MTKKHFILIANVLASYKPIDIKLINELMNIFETINPNFKRGLFLKQVMKGGNNVRTR